MKKFLLLLLFFVNIGFLSSNEMLKFIPNIEKNSRFLESTFLNSDKVVKSYDLKTYSIQEFKNNTFHRLSNNEVEKEIDAFSNLIYSNDRLYLASGNNILFSYTEENGWNKFNVNDKFNVQNDKFRRKIIKLVEFQQSLFCLSNSYDILLVDSAGPGGTIVTVIDTTYNEILSFKNDQLKVEFNSNGSLDGRFYDIASDDEAIWISGSGLYKFTDKIVETIDINNLVGLEPETKYYNIATNGDYVYLMKDYDPAGVKSKDSKFISYNKISKKVEIFDFPKIPSFQNSDNEIIVHNFNKMVFNNGIGYISTNIGIYKFDGVQLEYFDVFSEFLDQIPTYLYQYLSTSDISFQGSSFVISTVAGLIYSDVSSGVNESASDSFIKIEAYPNVLSESNSTITLNPNQDILVTKIAILDITGKESKVYEGIEKLHKGTNVLNLSDLSSGAYFFTINTESENFIIPIIIQK